MSISSFLLGLEDDAASIFHGVESGISTGIADVGGVVSLFEFLTSEEGWIRIFEVLFGGLLIIGAIRYGR